MKQIRNKDIKPAFKQKQIIDIDIKPAFKIATNKRYRHENVVVCEQRAGEYD